MSRNFELLKQIEMEVGAIDRPAPVTNDRALVKEPAPHNTGGLFSEEIARLVQTVFLSANAHATRLVVFCGVDGKSGSSTVCASAGRALAANSSKSVCLVDANLRSPRLSEAFRMDKRAPHSDKPFSGREGCVQIGENLWLAGTDLMADDRGALLSADRLKHRLTQLQDAFEYLLVDAPGTGVSRDATLLGQLADAAILVVEAGSTRRVTARKAKESLDAAGVHLLGTVLHNRSFPIPEGLYKRL